MPVVRFRGAVWLGLNCILRLALSLPIRRGYSPRRPRFLLGDRFLLAFGPRSLHVKREPSQISCSVYLC